LDALLTSDVTKNSNSSTERKKNTEMHMITKKKAAKIIKS